MNFFYDRGVFVEKDYRLGKEIRKVSNLIHRKLTNSKHRQFIEPTTAPNMWIIEHILRNSDRDIFQKDLEDEFSIRRSTVSKTLSLMEKKGLIKREAVSYDARLKKLTVTDKAIELNNLLREDIDNLEKSIKSGISESEMETFKTVMQKIINNIENNS